MQHIFIHIHDTNTFPCKLTKKEIEKFKIFGRGGGNEKRPSIMCENPRGGGARPLLTSRCRRRPW